MAITDGFPVTLFRSILLANLLVGVSDWLTFLQCYVLAYSHCYATVLSVGRALVSFYAQIFNSQTTY